MNFFKKNKYGNQKVNTNLGKFDSKFEFAKYNELILLERAGLISNLKRQVKIPLLCDEARISYIADFVYFDTKRGCIIIADAKGFKTEVFKIKKKILLSMYKNIEFLEFYKDTQTYTKPYSTANLEFNFLIA